VKPFLKELIANTLKRKGDQFTKRTSNEDDYQASPRIGWEPATTLFPPWMEDTAPE
jgi:hypothetical protein